MIVGSLCVQVKVFAKLDPWDWADAIAVEVDASADVDVLKRALKGLPELRVADTAFSVTVMGAGRALAASMALAAAEITPGAHADKRSVILKPVGACRARTRWTRGAQGALARRRRGEVRRAQGPYRMRPRRYGACVSPCVLCSDGRRGLVHAARPYVPAAAASIRIAPA